MPIGPRMARGTRADCIGPYLQENKTRVLQRSAHGYRDEDDLKLKIIAAYLPALPRNA